MHFDITTVIGLLGGVFYLASHYMKAMVPLRALSLGSNVMFITYGLLHTNFDLATFIAMPEILLNVILLPMEGDPMAPSAYWTLARRTRGSFLSPARDWP